MTVRIKAGNVDLGEPVNLLVELVQVGLPEARAPYHHRKYARALSCSLRKASGSSDGNHSGSRVVAVARKYSILLRLVRRI